MIIWSVDISFRHANPGAGNESFLLRIGSDADGATCVLVDAGRGVDVDALLTPGDHLAAICLTHAHLDHYKTLSANHRDGVPVVTSPATAAILDDVFDVARVEAGMQTSPGVTESITPVDDWTRIAPGVELHPVPAGHAPGAVGFLVRVTSGDGTYRLLATGDFTRRRAAGYPGLPADEFVDIDALFLCAATSNTFKTSLTDALGVALEHAQGGSRTLVTTSGLTGVQIAYLLSTLADEYELPVPVRVVGQVAKLYEALSYDQARVETIPRFEHTDECLEPGTITIAGPDRPTERSSGRLFGVLREDPNACVVQLIGSGKDPLTAGRCTIHGYELINHPTRETLTAVHDSIRPTHTIITHRHRGAKSEFNDLDSVVWASGDTDQYTLLETDRWQLPPWMDGKGPGRRRTRYAGQFAETAVLDSLRLPSIDRHRAPDVGGEGVDAERLAVHLHQGPNDTTDPDVPDRLTGVAAADASGARTTPPNMTSDTTDSDSSDETDSQRSATHPIRAVSVDIGDHVDPRVQEVLEEKGFTREEFTHLLDEYKRVHEETAGTPTTDQENRRASDSGSDATESGEDPALRDEQTVATDEEEPTDRDATEANVSTESAAGSVDPEVEAIINGESEAPVASQTGTNEPESVNDPEPSEEDEPNPTSEEAMEPRSESPTDESGLAVALNPLVVTAAEHAVRSGASFDDEFATLDELVVTAVSEYIVALLAGEVSGTDDDRVVIDLNTNPAIEQGLERVIAESDRFDSVSDLVVTGVLSVLDTETRHETFTENLEAHRRSLAAIAQNDAYAFDTPTAVVEAAVLWFLTAQ
jgi:putative mRNA 3-end processing factor